MEHGVPTSDPSVLPSLIHDAFNYVIFDLWLVRTIKVLVIKDFDIVDPIFYIRIIFTIHILLSSSGRPSLWQLSSRAMVGVNKPSSWNPDTSHMPGFGVSCIGSH